MPQEGAGVAQVSARGDYEGEEVLRDGTYNREKEGEGHVVGSAQELEVAEQRVAVMGDSSSRVEDELRDTRKIGPDGAASPSPQPSPRSAAARAGEEESCPDGASGESERESTALQIDPPPGRGVGERSPCPPLHRKEEPRKLGEEEHAIDVGGGEGGGGEGEEWEDALSDLGSCRICLMEADEVDVGRQLMKMECQCKGEMGLVHVDCALKWFTLRGSRVCDVCNSTVRNLPESIDRAAASGEAGANSAGAAQALSLDGGFRNWKEMGLLVLTSMIVYSVFFEEIVAARIPNRSFLVAVPYGCLVGLLCSFAAQGRVQGPSIFVFSYSLFQFFLIMGLACLFFRIMKLIPEVSLLLSSLLGMATAWGTHPLVTTLHSCLQQRPLNAPPPPATGRPPTTPTSESTPARPQPPLSATPVSPRTSLSLFFVDYGQALGGGSLASARPAALQRAAVRA